jgi:hypothetical protein
MRWVALIFLSAWACASYASTWKLAVQNQEASFYLDAASITRNGSVVEYWQLLDFNTPKVNRKGFSYRSMKSQFQMNCAKREVKMIFTVVYSEAFGKGGVVDQGPVKESNRPVVPGSSAEAIYATACKS